MCGLGRAAERRPFRVKAGVRCAHGQTRSQERQPARQGLGPQGRQEPAVTEERRPQAGRTPRKDAMKVFDGNRPDITPAQLDVGRAGRVRALGRLRRLDPDRRADRRAEHGDGVGGRARARRRRLARRAQRGHRQGGSRGDHDTGDRVELRTQARHHLPPAAAFVRARRPALPLMNGLALGAAADHRGCRARGRDLHRPALPPR